MKYASEEFNLKLFFFYLIKRGLYVLASILVGAGLFAGIYFLATEVIAPEDDYEATGKLYLEYTDEIKVENVYINAYTWEDLFKTDDVYNRVHDYLSADDQSADFFTREQLESAVNVTLLTDVRVLTVTAKAPAEMTAVRFADAYMAAISDFALSTNDITEVKVLTPVTSAKRPVKYNRIWRMTLLGAVLGLIVSVFAICILFALDDSFHIPEIFTGRYSIPVLGTFVGNKLPDWNSKALKMEIERVFGTEGKIFFTDADTDEIPEYVTAPLKEMIGQERMVTTGSVGFNPDNAKDLAGEKNIVLLVNAKARNGRKTDRTLSFCEMQGVKPVAAILYDTDAFVYNGYIFSPVKKNKPAEIKEE